MTRLLLVDDHPLIRGALREALLQEGFAVVGEAGSWPELQPLLQSVAYDVLLLDINLPGTCGLEVLELLAERPQPPRVIVVSMYPEDAYAAQAIRAGAWGYVSKANATRELPQAIRTVAGGQRYLPDAVALLIAQQDVAAAQAPHERLSEQERQLLLLLAAGRRLAEVAAALGLTARAASVYRARLLEKLKLASNAELAQYAVQHRLLAPGARS